MKDLYKPTLRTFFMVVPLLVGVWVYSRGRTTNTRYESWFQIPKSTGHIPLSGSLPDYLWCLSLLSAMVLLWKGWNKIPAVWKFSIWLLVCSTELFQYLHLLPGTGDLVDLLFYQAAFASVILLNKTDII